MKLIKSAVLIFAALVSLNVIARTPVPIINYDNISVATSSGKTLQLEQVKQSIQAAAGAKAWSIAFQADGKLLATLNVRNKHVIVVEIAYSADKYSLRYKDSTNMKFGEASEPQAAGLSGLSPSRPIGPGTKVIHPYYNKWVAELKDAIRVELLKL
jgi:hypothetical protein